MNEDTHMTETKRLLAKKLDAVGWGLFFLWMGIAVLAHVGWGVGILGVGVLMLGGQAARKSLGLPVAGVGVLVGGLLFFSGVWGLLGLRLGRGAIPGGFLPILFIVAGAWLLVAALRRRPAHR